MRPPELGWGGPSNFERAIAREKLDAAAPLPRHCGARERKLCYYLLPIKREISTPLSFGADPKGVCKKLERKSAEVCAIKYPIGGAAGAAAGGKQEPIDYKKMRVKHLKQILTERGVKIKRVWSSKRDFVKACEESEHLAPEL